MPLDIGCTLAWIQQYSAQYGTNSSEPPRVTLVGYSSGAGVVASVMLGSDQFIPVPQGTLSEITGVLTMSGNYDYKKAEAAGIPFFEWYYIHGQPDAALETSPLEQGSPAPTSTISVPWIVEHEQCDADEHYSDAQRLTDALNSGWDQSPAYLYENTQSYMYNGYPYTPMPQAGAATHGDGQSALALVGSPLYKVLTATIDGSPPTPTAVPTWENVPLLAGVTNVTDVAEGRDSTIWIVSNTPAPGDANDFIVAKYADKANMPTLCVTVPVTAPGAARRIAVDAYGDPWIVSNAEAVSRLVGGLVAAQPTYSPGLTGGIGTASTYAPAPGSQATDIGAGGGTASGSEMPPVYNHYPRNIGIVQITSTSATGGSPPAGDYLLQHWTGSSWTTNDSAWGVKLGVDSIGKAWLALADGTIWTTEPVGSCTTFCQATGAVATDIGAGGQNVWIVPVTAALSELEWTPVAEPTAWAAVRVPFTPDRVSVSPDGLPVAVDSSGGLWIYHPCSWPDGSPGGGSTTTGPCASFAAAAAASGKRTRTRLNHN